MMPEPQRLAATPPPPAATVEAELIQQVRDAIAREQLTLPTLPEVALSIRNAADDPDVSVQSLAREIGKDPALAARLIQIANSPLMRGRASVDSLNSAITRLGMDFVKNLVAGLLVEQMFLATSEAIEQRMRKAWNHSVEVAAVSFVLAARYTRLPPEQAMLAGLIHEIGCLPILTLAERHADTAHNPAALERVIRNLHPKLGVEILRAWDFPVDLAEMPVRYANFGRKHEGDADYADLISVANLYVWQQSQHRHPVKWQTVPAVAKLGIATDAEELTLPDELIAQIEETRSLLQ